MKNLKNKSKFSIYALALSFAITTLVLITFIITATNSYFYEYIYEDGTRYEIDVYSFPIGSLISAIVVILLVIASLAFYLFFINKKDKIILFWVSLIMNIVAFIPFMFIFTYFSVRSVSGLYNALPTIFIMLLVPLTMACQIALITINILEIIKTLNPNRTNKKKLINDQNLVNRNAIAAYNFMVINTIIMGIFIIPLAWLIPMTLMYKKRINQYHENFSALFICTIIFGGSLVLTIPAVLLLLFSRKEDYKVVA